MDVGVLTYCSVIFLILPKASQASKVLSLLPSSLIPGFVTLKLSQPWQVVLTS